MRRDEDEDDDGTGAADDVVNLPIDGNLDLHAFRPADVASLVDEYLTACRERGILHVRIAHGKGIGVLRETVHELLRCRDDVESFRLDSETGSGWGATLVSLRGRA
jgi:DNA-nicking Smr family endonuclease